MGQLNITSISRLTLSASALFLLISSPLDGASLTLASSMSGPAPLGTIVTWTVTASDDAAANLWYRFRVRYLGTVPDACAIAARAPVHSRCASTDFSTVRDYGPC